MKALLTLLMIAGFSAAAWYLPGAARHHYCETGVVYTTEYMTLHLPGGVVGFPPGSRLRECFTIHVPDKEVVTDGKYTLAVDPEALTHDVEYAGELAASDQQSQDRTQAGIARGLARSAANRHEAELVAAQDIERINATMVASAIVDNYASALSRPGGGVGAYGSYGGGGYASGGASSGTVVNNVTATQNNLGGGNVASRGRPAASYAPLPGKVTSRKEPGSDLAAMGTNP